MPRGWLRREPSAPPPPAPPTAAQEVAALRTSLRETVARTNRAAGRLPVGVVPQVRAIEDALRELLDHVAATAGSATSAQERYTLAATIEDYLPTSLNAYLALPPAFAATHRSAAGLTPGEELYEQLVLLEQAVRDLAVAIYSGDAQRLSAQGRFLESKFAASELDLR